jgi:Domain of unknown function (DUF4131)
VSAPASARAKPYYYGGQEPIFLVAFAFSIGNVAANYFWRSPLLWLIAFFVAIGGAAFLHRRSPQIAFVLALLATVPLGGFYLQARDAAQPVITQALQPFATGQNQVEVTGYVIREGLVRDGHYGGKQESVDVRTERLQQGDRSLDVAVGIRLTLYSKQTEEDDARELGADSPLRVYTYGQRLRFTAKLQFGETSALLVGDSHKRIEKLLVTEALQADLLKVGHHGSTTSSTPEFLAAVNPRFAVVSVGFYNSFHHPRPDVMQRYADAQIRTYRTDLAGAVSFFLDGKTITAKPVPR